MNDTYIAPNHPTLQGQNARTEVLGEMVISGENSNEVPYLARARYPTYCAPLPVKTTVTVRRITLISITK